MSQFNHNFAGWLKYFFFSQYRYKCFGCDKKNSCVWLASELLNLFNASQSLNDTEMVLQEQAWLVLVGKGYIFFLCGIPLIFCIMTLQSNTGLDSTAWMPNPSWVLTEMKYETTSDDRKEVRATSFCAIKFYPNKSPGRSKYTKPSTKTTNYLKS